MLVFIVLATLASVAQAANNVINIHWNSSNPMFKRDTPDNIIDINGNNHAWEYDQVNIVCPVYKSGTDPALQEKYIIYSVTQDEYDSCRITQADPKIVAICDRPYELMYFTITFRSFTPTPGGLEFAPGKDYYFISTSSKRDLHRRVGGGCSTNNMKVIFRVAPAEHANDGEVDNNDLEENKPLPAKFPWSQDRDFRRTFSPQSSSSTYFSYPRSEMEEMQRQQRERRPKSSSSTEYNAIKREAVVSSSATSNVVSSSLFSLLLIVVFLRFGR